MERWKVTAEKQIKMSKVLTPRETQLRDIIVGQRLSANELCLIKR